MHGLWLEGASWDREGHVLIETITSSVYEPFPAIKVKTVKKSDEEIENDDGLPSDFEDNPELSKKELKAMAEREVEYAKEDVEDNRRSKTSLLSGGRRQSNAGLNRADSGFSQHDSNYNFKKPAP